MSLGHKILDTGKFHNFDSSFDTTHFISFSPILSWSKYHHMLATHIHQVHLAQHTALFWIFFLEIYM